MLRLCRALLTFSFFDIRHLRHRRSIHYCCFTNPLLFSTTLSFCCHSFTASLLFDQEYTLLASLLLLAFYYLLALLGRTRGLARCRYRRKVCTSYSGLPCFDVVHPLLRHLYFDPLLTASIANRSSLINKTSNPRYTKNPEI